MKALLFLRYPVLTMICILILFAFSANLHAAAPLAKRTWDGSESTDWFDGDNWEDGAVPGITDEAEIPGSLTNYPDIISGSAYAKKIKILSGATFTISGGAIYLDGEFKVSSGGSLFQSGGVIHGEKTGGTPDQSFTNEGSTTQSGGTINCKDFIVKKTGAIFNQSGTNSLITIGKDFKIKNNAIFNSTGGTIRWTGMANGGNGVTFNDGTYQFYNMQFDGTAVPNFQKTGGSILVRGNWTNNNPNVDLTGSKATTVTFNGSSDQTIGGSISTTFDNLVINTTSSATVTSTGDQNVDGTATITAGTLEIASQSTFTANGMITNSAGITGLVIKSDENGTGSLLHVTNDVDATVEQRITANAWHYVSSPITPALSGLFMSIHLKPFDESIDDWGEYIPATNIPLNVMQGHSAWVSGTPTTVSFEGDLNNGDQSIGVTCRDYDPLVESGGWNLVGNPYPSAVDWDAAGWVKDEVDNTIYFYSGNGGTGNYIYYQGSGGEVPGIGSDGMSSIIPANQGFFVHVHDDGVPGVVNGTLGVSNSVRVHSDQAYNKNTGENEIPVIRLETSNASNLTDETIIRFYPGSTIAQDGDYDAYKLFGWMYPQIYSTTSTQVKLAINTLPEYNDATIIPIGFQSPEEGEYSIRITEFSNFDQDVTLYLEDLKNDKMHNVSDNPEYVFSSIPADDPNRFLLHFSENETPGNSVVRSSTTIYSFNQTVYVQIPENADQAVVNVFNMMGQKVLVQNITGQEVAHLNMNGQSGHYLVTVQMGTQYASEKIYIR